MKVNIENFNSVGDFPNFLTAGNLSSLGPSMASQGVGFSVGGHVIKVGMGPTLADIICDTGHAALLINGAVLIHDLEIAYSGETSEDVDTLIKTGSWGLREETVEFFKEILNTDTDSFYNNLYSVFDALPYKEFSLLWKVMTKGIQPRICWAMGCDTVFMHLDKLFWLKMAEFSHMSFVETIEEFKESYAWTYWITMGSSVLLPEFLAKAYNYAKSISTDKENVHIAHAVIMDSFPSYRQLHNAGVRIAERTTVINVPHEISIPLLWKSIKGDLNV